MKINTKLLIDDIKEIGYAFIVFGILLKYISFINVNNIFKK